MLRGIYASASGLNVQQNRLDAVAGNIANVNTVGYKKDAVAAGPFFERLIERDDPAERPAGRLSGVGGMTLGAELEAVRPWLNPGPVVETRRNADLAIAGEGFFSVETGDGRVLYTRDGSFRRDRDGYLVTARGDRVLGQNGPILIQEDGFKVTEDGRVVTAGGVVDKLAVYRFNAEELQKDGANCFAAPAGARPAAVQDPRILQGYLEMSNVDPVDEMVTMMEAHRLYQFNQRLLRAQDELLGKAVNQLGTVK
ncbi:MAG: flagellar basal-body rod protein FlgF [Firmicutes bacterium]|nr:flagellar basal-body rod protein FlgF [Bacillota bacterium]